MASLDVLRIFLPSDIDVKGLGVQDKLSVACIITEIMVAMMRRAAKAGRQLPFAKPQFATVARHLAHRATSCSLDSIFQALKPTRLVKGRPLVAALKVLLTDDTDGEELEASVLGIIDKMGLSRCFSASLLQPLPEVLERLSGAWQSVHDAKVALYLLAGTDPARTEVPKCGPWLFPGPLHWRGSQSLALFKHSSVAVQHLL